MESPFDFAHLDPSCDPPEGYVAAFELLATFWCELRALRSECSHDQFLSGFIAHLETELVGAAFVLAIQVELLTAR
ncbi:hypothetical protein [Bradyrhizobium sp. AUGA SZCCT0182]|uniref:hypothetical protein n=1 Tax=Bradyrhizobium sp. AUGA SZCCT0182 TaxID=2807667 RepID=UPI001BA54577|nr:hypothetical protein [Bradyrhizobium sp. AUGA SZCCT0182]MBR1232817.1 hypothetical protein [Bradyrhizobium sp. AUGA SZCCT0182]